jgi:hypothetical protein
MTHLPKAALLAALMFGTAGAVVATPALAKKKEEAAATTTLKVNENVRKGQAAALGSFGKIRPLLAADGSIPANNRQAVMDAINGAEPGIAAAEAAAQTNDELYVAQELRYRKQSLLLAAQGGGAPAQAALAPYIDKLLANPVTPKESIGTYALERGRIAFGMNQFPAALAFFQRAKAAGSTEPLLDAFIVDTRVKMGDYGGAAGDAEKMIATMKAAGQKVPESYYAIGIENAYRSKNFSSAVNYEIRRLGDYPETKNFHDALIRLMTRSPTPLDLRQRLDVWRLLRASGALADQNERINYASDALDAGASREAQAVLEEFAKGKTPAQLDAKFNAALASARTRSASATPLAKAEADAKAGNAQQALTAGNFNYAAGNYAKAVELYQLADQRGVPDKDALKLSLGAAQAQAGDKAGAIASLQAVTGSPRKEIAGFWLAWVNSRP